EVVPPPPNGLVFATELSQCRDADPVWRCPVREPRRVEAMQVEARCPHPHVGDEPASLQESDATRHVLTRPFAYELGLKLQHLGHHVVEQCPPNTLQISFR